MATLASALLLTVVTMAQANQMSEVQKLPPHKHHVYIFDVKSEASVEDLKAALNNFTIQRSYKVISSATVDLQVLTFPAYSEVTQHPVEHIEELLGMFEAGNGLEEDDTDNENQNTVLFLLDRRIQLPESTCMSTFATDTREWARQYKQSHNVIKLKVYPIVSSYPVRVLVRGHTEENTMQNIVKMGLPATGGIGEAQIQTKRVVWV